MRYVYFAIVAAILPLTLAGCQAQRLRAPVKPPRGILFTHHEAPITVSYSNTPAGTKEGVASTYYVHDFLITGLDFAWGEAGIQQAARRGEIENIHYADYRRMQILGFFGKYTTEVHGE